MHGSASRWVVDFLLTESVPVRASCLSRPTSHRGCHVASSISLTEGKILSRAAAALFRNSHGQQLCFDPQMTWQSPS